ncbi:MAG: DUF1003 domain-containing protein [Gemmatimonadaceae bacterium]
MREVVQQRLRWHEGVVERVARFIGHPYFIAIHVVWFVLWIAINTGLIAVTQRFDDSPFGLLGIVLAIEAILVTGILLISQNRQSAHADTRAELDYDVNVRTYREIHEIKRMLGELEQRIADGTGNSAGSR